MELWLLILFGFFGGAIRVIVGLFKHNVVSGKEKFKSGRFWFTIIGSALIGGFCALLTIEDYRIALLAGYAGTDFLQGMYKIAT
jgi:fluoride ion exporter CrcB/FEX